MNLLRRIVPRLQESRCADCGLALRERRRRPCPACGEIARIHVRSIDMGGVTARDRMG